MSSKTTNYNLHKIDLNDSPPDITVLNQNFDILDEKLKEAMESGGCTPDEIGALALDGSNSMTGQLHTPRVFFDRSNGVYGDGGIYKANQNANASTQIMDRGSNNKFATLAVNGQSQNLSLTFGVQNADGTLSTTSVNQIYHEGNKPTCEEIGAVAKTGDTMSGNLTFKKAENGEGAIFKNHSSSADYGLVIKDTDKDGDYVALSLQGANNAITFRDNSGKINNVCHSGNIATQVNSLLTGGEISMVKSVQRGIIKYGVTPTKDTGNMFSEVDYYVKVTVNAVSDISKCFVHANGASSRSCVPVLCSPTELRIYTNIYNGSPASTSGYSWEVVEFY